MTGLKNQMLRAVAHNALRQMSSLADQYPHAPPEEKEVIQAGIDFERWLAETCEECLSSPEKC